MWQPPTLTSPYFTGSISPNFQATSAQQVRSVQDLSPPNFHLSSILPPYCHQHDMKLGSACSQCRIGKRKCIKSAPGSACDQCIKRSLNCSSLSRHTSSRAKLLPNSATADAQSSLPSARTTEELVDLYICYIHNKPHTLFHEPSLRQAAKDGSLSHAVLFGIAGLSAR